MLGLKSSIKGNSEFAKNSALLLSISGRKSFDEAFYNTVTGLSFSRTRPLQRIRNVRLETTFGLDRQPQGIATLFANIVRVGGSILVKNSAGLVDQLRLVGHYRRANNRLIASSEPSSERATENAFELTTILDGTLAKGFVRGATWFDAAGLNNSADSYSRLAGTIGYSRDFHLPQKVCAVVTIDGGDTCLFPSKNAPAIGVEILLGAGTSFGTLPGYARFYGGNSTDSFLYEGIENSSWDRFPHGPLIRSFGSRSAGIRLDNPASIGGSTSYWHFNLSTSLPIPAWSRPLIPAETVIVLPDDSGKVSCKDCTSLKSLIKNQAGSGKNMFIDALAFQKLSSQERDDLSLSEDEGLTPEEKSKLERAERAFKEARVAVTPEADAVWQRLSPTISYIADKANLFAIKPLLLFDVERSYFPDDAQQRVRTALGTGLQLNIVIAKFETGYLRTLRHLPGDQRGNFFVRMVFQRLF